MKKFDFCIRMKHDHDSHIHEDYECVFCLERFDTTEIEPEYTYYLGKIYTSTLTLKCNHTFHINCFIKYISHNYKNNTKFNRIVNKEIINCPLCRHSVSIISFFKIMSEYIHLLKSSKHKLSKEIHAFNKQITYKRISNKIKYILKRPVYLEDLRSLYTLENQVKEFTMIRDNIDNRVRLIRVIRFETIMAL